MDKKTKKEIDKEIKEIRKTTLIANKRIQKLVGLKDEDEPEEENEEDEELEDYLKDVNEEEVSSILLKAEQEMKEEEEEKKRGIKEKKENDEKMERILREELERMSDDEKEKKKKKKNKAKKKKEKEKVEEYKKWKKMRKMQKEKKKAEKNKKEKKEEKNEEKKEEKIEEKKEELNNNNDVNNNKNEKNIKNIDNNGEQKEDEKDKEENDNEYNFNINDINNINENNNNNNNNLKKEENNGNNNKELNNNINNNIENNNIQQNNDIQQNNKPGPIIPKNVYDQVSSADKKIITDLLKAGNAKHQEGEMFYSSGKYSEAIKCYYQAKNIYMSINKLIQTRKNAYPKEFRRIITSKITDKLKLVHQCAKNCSNANKQRIIGHFVNKNPNLNYQNNNQNDNQNNNLNYNQNDNQNYNQNNNNQNNNKNKNISNTINNNINNNNIKNNKNFSNTVNYKLNNTNNNMKENPNTNNNKNTNNYNFDFNALNNNNNDNNNYNNNKLRSNNINNNNTNINNQNKPKSLHDKEEDAMDQKILSEIMTKNPGVKFSDIIGMNDMKQTLYEIIVVPTIRPDLFTGIRTPQRGILLFGPPGTGKTMIAKAIASECGSTFFNISASSLTSKWVGESEKTVKSLFKIAYQKVPSIIFIDEIDSILSKRSESENEATKRLKTEFLIQFDGLGSNTSARLLVIAATNRPMDLDEALLRRLPKRVYCGPLDEAGRFEFIKKVINRVETDLSDEDIKEIAKMTNDYSNSDLMELCREAAYKPVQELTNEEIMKLDKFRPINKKDLIDAAHKIRGTLSKKVKEDLRKWNEQFGGV